MRHGGLGQAGRGDEVHTGLSELATCGGAEDPPGPGRRDPRRRSANPALPTHLPVRLTFPSPPTPPCGSKGPAQELPRPPLLPRRLPRFGGQAPGQRRPLEHGVRLRPPLRGLPGRVLIPSGRERHVGATSESHGVLLGSAREDRGGLHRRLRSAGSTCTGLGRLKDAMVDKLKDPFTDPSAYRKAGGEPERARQSVAQHHLQVGELNLINLKLMGRYMQIHVLSPAVLPPHPPPALRRGRHGSHHPLQPRHQAGSVNFIPYCPYQCCPRSVTDPLWCHLEVSTKSWGRWRSRASCRPPARAHSKPPSHPTTLGPPSSPVRPVRPCASNRPSQMTDWDQPRGQIPPPAVSRVQIDVVIHFYPIQTRGGHNVPI